MDIINHFQHLKVTFRVVVYCVIFKIKFRFTSIIHFHAYVVVQRLILYLVYLMPQADKCSFNNKSKSNVRFSNRTVYFGMSLP